MMMTTAYNSIFLFYFPGIRANGNVLFFPVSVVLDVLVQRKEKTKTKKLNAICSKFPADSVCFRIFPPNRDKYAFIIQPLRCHSNAYTFLPFRSSILLLRDEWETKNENIFFWMIKFLTKLLLCNYYFFTFKQKHESERKSG